MKKLVHGSFVALLVALIAAGVAIRFSWANWSQGTNLHPDEYGLTNTLTQLSIPKSLSGYFNTRLSPLSPYDKYDVDGNKTANGPDNRMRWGQWPLMIIRGTAQLTGSTGYDNIRLLGRSLSALADGMSLLFLFLIGRALFGWQVGLLAAGLGALTVLDVQQSHFMTVDTFALAFTSIALFGLVRLAQVALLQRPEATEEEKRSEGTAYQIKARGAVFLVLFSVAFAMAIASRVNLLPLLGLLPVAAFVAVADLGLRRRSDLRRVLSLTGFLLGAALVLAGVTFRLLQPMSFRAPAGDTTVLTLTPNKDWLDSMGVAMNESAGIGGGPPGEQWANRTPIIFPWINMVLWGMGLPLGLAASVGILWAGFSVLRGREDWRLHAVLLLWGLGYFLFMGTRFVKSIRYFLPVYPVFCLYAAWLLWGIWGSRRARPMPGSVVPRKATWTGVLRGADRIVRGAPLALVLAGTAVWLWAFVQAVYLKDHTRIEASRWMYANIPQGSVIVNESWDEGLPLPIDGKDPYGSLYKGLTMEVRWYDSPDKRAMFLENLAQADYVVLSSQRAIWSTCRLPLTYPMTMDYYQALFDGKLGFKLVAHFERPLRIGPLVVSDLAGEVGWGSPPSLPVFNYSPYAAEEAFSVYDHPPVWIFQKEPGFDLAKAASILDAADLSKVVVQSPRDVPSSLYR